MLHLLSNSRDVIQAENDELGVREEPRVDFSGEEGQGRFLDLHEHYQTFINSKFGFSKEEAPKEYQEYVTSITELTQIPRQHRTSRGYRYNWGLCNAFVCLQDGLQALTKAFLSDLHEFAQWCCLGSCCQRHLPSMSCHGCTEVQEPDLAQQSSCLLWA